MKLFKIAASLLVCFVFVIPITMADPSENLLPSEGLITDFPQEFKSMEELIDFFGFTTHINSPGRFFETNESIIKDYSMPTYQRNSSSGFTGSTRINGRLYRLRLASRRLTDSNYGPVRDTQFLINVADGQTKSMTDSVEVCNTIGFSGGISAAITKFLTFSFTSSYSHKKCEKFTKGQSFSFPNHCGNLGFNSASFYGGETRDRYIVTVDLAPYERLDPEEYRRCIRSCRNDRFSDPMDVPVEEEFEFKEEDNLIIDVDGFLIVDNLSRRPSRCIEECQMENPMVLKLNEMYSETGYVFSPRKIAWSVCNIVN